MLRVGSFFSGIEGFGLGLERAGGFELAFSVERDEFCQQVIRKHWPDLPIYGDVRDVHAADSCPRRGCGNCLPAVDVVCGGFPCQDLSYAGRGVGLDGERSGLWTEMFRLICELRPQYVLVENVSALLARGMGRVLGDLAQGGYDAEWDCLPASAFGAPHRRDRVWLVAYPAWDAEGRPAAQPGAEWQRTRTGGQSSGARDVADTGRECGELGRGSGDLLRSTREAQGEGLQRQRGGCAAGDRGAGGRTLAGAHPDADGAGLRVERGAQRLFGEGGLEDAPWDIADGLRPSGPSANADSSRREQRWGPESDASQQPAAERGGQTVANAAGFGLQTGTGLREGRPGGLGRGRPDDSGTEIATDTDSRRRGSRERDLHAGQPDTAGSGEGPADSPSARLEAGAGQRMPRAGRPRELAASDDSGAGGERCAQPGLGGSPDGLPAWLDRVAGLNFWADGQWDTVPRVATGVKDRRPRLQALGNSLVPQISQWLGFRILLREEGVLEEPILPGVGQ